MKRVGVLLPVCLAILAGAVPAHAWTWPVDGPVLQPFTFGSDPYAAGQHRGVDIGGPSGAHVVAPVAGAVTFAGSVPGGGRTVTIATADGYSVTLVHLGTVAVAKGVTVVEGESVGTIGPSGEAELAEPYVHLGVRVAADEHGYVDPLGLLPARGGAEQAPAVSAPSAAESEPGEPPGQVEAGPAAMSEEPATATPPGDSGSAGALQLAPPSAEGAREAEPPAESDLAAVTPAPPPVEHAAAPATTPAAAAAGQPVPSQAEVVRSDSDTRAGSEPAASPSERPGRRGSARVERGGRAAPETRPATFPSASSSTPAEHAVGQRRAARREVEPGGAVRAKEPGREVRGLRPAAVPGIEVATDRVGAGRSWWTLSSFLLAAGLAGGLMLVSRRGGGGRAAAAGAPPAAPDPDGSAAPETPPTPAPMCLEGSARSRRARALRCGEPAHAARGSSPAIRPTKVPPVASRIIAADDLLRDNADLLRQLDAPYRSRLHDNRGRRRRAPPPPAR
jgi:Peptidase family M23